MEGFTVKIRLMADSEEECEAVRAHLLALHPGLALGAPREGSNPKYAANQKWSSYGDIVLTQGGELRRRRKTATTPRIAV